MEVVKGQERRWEALASELVVRREKIVEIESTDHNDIQRMEAVVDDYVRYHPGRSWGHVASALQRMGLLQRVDVVTAKCIPGI